MANFLEGKFHSTFSDPARDKTRSVNFGGPTPLAQHLGRRLGYAVCQHRWVHEGADATPPSAVRLALVALVTREHLADYACVVAVRDDQQAGSRESASHQAHHGPDRAGTWNTRLTFLDQITQHL